MRSDAADHVLVIGAGHAGIQALDSLRAAGFAGRLTVVSDEDEHPYQKPPLSKGLTEAEAGTTPLPLRPRRFFDENAIETRWGARVISIDRSARTVELGSGERLEYTALILATGAHHRSLPVPGADLSGVHMLRSLQEAEQLRAALAEAQDVVIVGAGFIGLEVAACANAMGRTVTVLEFADRPMARAVSETLGRHVAEAHRAAGIDLRLGEGLARIDGEAGRVRAVEGAGGEQIPADLVLLGVGVLPAAELAESAGLVVDDGIAVDATLRTSDPSIFAIGDCASFPSPHLGRRVRLESVQNATDQARHVAAQLTASDDPVAAAGDSLGGYADVPWFWSDQGEVRIQIAGLLDAADETLVRGDPAGGSFSVLAFRDGVLAAVESVNAPRDHRAARKLLGRGVRLTAEDVGDDRTALKDLARTTLEEAS